MAFSQLQHLHDKLHLILKDSSLVSVCIIGALNANCKLKKCRSDVLDCNHHLWGRHMMSKGSLLEIDNRDIPARNCIHLSNSILFSFIDMETLCMCIFYT